MTTSRIYNWPPVGLGWLLLTVLTGLFIATQPPDLLLIGLCLVVFILAAILTPLAAAVVLLILAPMRTLIATEAQFQLPVDIGQIAFMGLLFAWVLHRVVFRHKLPQLHWTPLYIPLLLFITVIGLTAFNAASLSLWLNEWLKWIQIAIMIAFVLDIATGDKWRWLLFGLVMAGLANALVGLYEFLGGSGADHLLIGGRFFRAFGTFGQPNPFAGFMGLLAPLALAAAAGYGLRYWRQRYNINALLLAGFYLLAGGFIALGIGISWSRGAWLGFGAALGVMAFALPRRTRYGAALLIAMLVAGGLLWFAGLLPASITARISSSTEEFFAFQDVRGVDITSENYAVVERLSHWQAAVNMARSHPWLGVGMGNYPAVYADYRLINWDEPLGHAHNYYLNMLAEAGIVGLLAYGKVWLVIISLSWYARRHPDTSSRLIIIGLLGAWAYLSVHSFFDNLYVNNMFLHLGVMLGILAVLHKQAAKPIKLVGT